MSREAGSVGRGPDANCGIIAAVQAKMDRQRCAVAGDSRLSCAGSRRNRCAADRDAAGSDRGVAGPHRRSRDPPFISKTEVDGRTEFRLSGAMTIVTGRAQGRGEYSEPGSLK